MLKLKPISWPYLIITALLVLFTGCGKDDGADGVKPSLARLDAETVNYFTTTNRIATQGAAGLRYEASIRVEGDTQWCSFDLFPPTGAVTEKSGEVGTSIFLSLRENTTEENRTATITVTFSDNYTTTLTMTQLAYSSTALYDRQWGEQPAYREGGNYIYKTYHTKFYNGNPVRNYSICYGPDKHVSYWVAYPLHSSYTRVSNYPVGTKTPGRTDAWAYDDTQTEYMSSSPYYRALGRTVTQPPIAEGDQQYIIRSYGAGGYQRGHMLPSAARYNNWNSNAQTFYATNMMPQYGNFNGGIWGTLESKARGWAGSNSNDTLFVVTGTLFKDTKTISNNNGPIAVPSHCWKVMLRVRNGSGKKQIGECSATELKAIAFIFSNDAAGAATTLREAACSVSDIEELTGFRFFRNLSPDAVAVKESYQFSDWSGL